MLRLVAAVVLIGVAALAACGRLERALVYPFDPSGTAAPAGLAESRLRTGDGEMLVVWSAPSAPGKPTVVYFHGNGGNLAARADRFGAFTARGYGLVAAGYRGSSGSTGTPTEAALIADAETLAAALPRLAGPGKRVYYGESLGAAVAIALAKRQPPDALVLEAPFVSLAEMSRAVYGTPALARLARSRWPSRERIAQVTAPLYILHGALDPLVPPAQGRAVHDAAASPQKTFDLVAGAGHVDVWQPDAQRRLFAFLGGL